MSDFWKDERKKLFDMLAEFIQLKGYDFSETSLVWDWFYGLNNNKVLAEIEKYHVFIHELKKARGYTTYLCGGINGLTDAEATDWRTVAKDLLSTATLDPMRRDYRGKEDESVNEIVSGDLEDIKRADFILVNAARPSWGTAMEIVYAHKERAKKIYSVVPKPPISPWLRFHSTEIFPSLEEAVAKINQEAE